VVDAVDVAILFRYFSYKIEKDLHKKMNCLENCKPKEKGKTDKHEIIK